MIYLVIIMVLIPAGSSAFVYLVNEYYEGELIFADVALALFLALFGPITAIAIIVAVILWITISLDFWKKPVKDLWK